MTATLSYFNHETNTTLLAIGDDIPSLWNPYEVFSPKTYGARGNGLTDDTAAFQACIAAAELADGPALILIPPRTYLVQDINTSDHATASDGPLNIQGDHITVMGYGATLKVGPNGVSTSAVRVFGSFCKIRGLTIDCNAARTAANHVEGVNALRSKGNSGIEFNTGSDGFAGDCVVMGGDKGDANADDEDQSLGPMGGEDSYVCTNSHRTIFQNCKSLDAGWSGFKIGNSDAVQLNSASVINQRGHGIRVQGQIETIYIHKAVMRSTRCSGRSAIIIDPASGGSSTNRCENAWITECDCIIAPTTDFGGGSSNCLKLASCRLAYVTGGYYSNGDGTGGVTIRLEDALSKVVFRNVKIIGEISYAPRTGDMAEGQCVNSHTNSSGFSTIDLGVSNVAIGKSIYIQGSNNRNLNREHIVTAKPSSTTYTLATPYIAGTMGTNAWFHTCVDDSRYYNCDMTNQFGTGGTYIMTKVFSRTFIIEGGAMKQPTASTGKMSMIEWSMVRDENLKRIKITGVDVQFNSDKLCKLLRPTDNGTTEVQTLAFSSAITSGTFTITHNGNTTSPAVNFSTTVATLAANIQTALRLLSGLESVVVAHSSGAFGSGTVTFTVTFYGVPGNTVQMTASAAGLSGGTPTITPGTTTQGVISKMLLTAGKVICCNNMFSNNDAGTVETVDSNDANEAEAYPGRRILFASDGERLDAYMASAAPTLVDVPWPKGSIFRNSSPDTGEPSHWVCTTAGVRDTSVGTFSSSGNLA